jgi:hypothetical protein
MTNILSKSPKSLNIKALLEIVSQKETSDLLSAFNEFLLSKQEDLGLEVSLEDDSLTIYYQKEGINLRLGVENRTGDVRFSVDDELSSSHILRVMEKRVNEDSTGLLEAVLYLRYEVSPLWFGSF